MWIQELKIWKWMRMIDEKKGASATRWVGGSLASVGRSGDTTQGNGVVSAESVSRSWSGDWFFILRKNG